MRIFIWTGSILENIPSSRIKSRYMKFIKIVMDARSILPEVPIPENPVAVEIGVFAIGEPDEASPVLVTGNSLYTHAVVGAALTAADINCYLVSIDTDGYTVDMAALLSLFSGEKVRTILENSNIEDKVEHRILIIPGFAAASKRDVEEKNWLESSCRSNLYYGDSYLPSG